MEMIISIIKGTPWWVFAVFGYLCSVGWKARKTRVVSFKKLIIIPLIFSVWSLKSLNEKFGFGPLNLSIWAVAAAFGVYFGWLLVYSREVMADKSKGLLKIPGTWSSLVQFLLIFVCKYSFGVTYILHPEAKGSLIFFGSDIFLSGLLAGLFFGKLLGYSKKYLQASHTDLQIS